MAPARETAQPPNRTTSFGVCGHRCLPASGSGADGSRRAEHGRREGLDARECHLRPGSPGYFLSLIAALTLVATSGGMAAILCAVLACSAPLAITSASSLPSMTALQPGTT